MAVAAATIDVKSVIWGSCHIIGFLNGFPLISKSIHGSKYENLTSRLQIDANCQRYQSRWKPQTLLRLLDHTGQYSYWIKLRGKCPIERSTQCGCCQSVSTSLPTCSLSGSSPCSGSQSRGLSPPPGSPLALPSSATPRERVIPLRRWSSSTPTPSTTMSRWWGCWWSASALSLGLVWRWLGVRLLGGLEGVAVQSRPSTFASGHRSLSRTTHQHPPTWTHPPAQPAGFFFLVEIFLLMIRDWLTLSEW